MQPTVSPLVPRAVLAVACTAFALCAASAVAGGETGATDARQLVFLRGGNHDPGLFLMDVRTRDARRLTHGVDVHPQWDRGGRSLLFTRKAPPGSKHYWVAYMLRDLKHLVRLRAGLGATWSPDGRFIAVSGHGDAIELLDFRSGTRRRLSRTRGIRASMSWSRTGRDLIYSANASAHDRDSSRLIMYNVDRGTATEVWRSVPPKKGLAEIDSPSLSSDGRLFAFTLTTGTWPHRPRIFLLRRGEEHPYRVTPTDVDAMDPAWRPGRPR